jgi:membrane protein
MIIFILYSLQAFCPVKLIPLCKINSFGRVVAKGQDGLSLGFAIGLLFALWSANAGMKTLMDALNIVNEEKEKRSFVRLNLVSLAFTVAAMVAMLCAVGAVVVTPLLLSPVGLAGMTEEIVRFACWPALTAAMLLGLSLLYRYGPQSASGQVKLSYAPRRL